MMDDDTEMRAMEQDKPKIQEDEDEFLDGSRSNKSGAVQHLDRQHNHHHPVQQDGSRVDDPGGPASTMAAPAGGAVPPAAAPAMSKEMLQVEVELRLLEALEIYQPAKLQGVHRHFVLYGLMEYLERRLNHHFSADEILGILNRFYNLDLLKSDEEGNELLSQEEDFSLPASILSIKEEFEEIS